MEHSQDIINECWRSIDGYINYQVSNIGRVRKADSGKIMSDKRRAGRGYAIVGLYKDGNCKNFKIHRLVAEQFIPKPHGNVKLEVDHIDRNKTNNIVSNLRWVSHQQNAWNKIKTCGATSSKYVGVALHKSRNKWEAYIGHDSRRLYLGIFNTDKDAARCYNKKAYELRGEFAVLNDISDDET